MAKENKVKKEKSRRQTGLSEVMKRMSRNKLSMVGLAILVILVLSAIFADVIAPFKYNEIVADPFVTPNSEFIFGTDHLGRDIFSRVVYGSRISLKVGFISVSIALIFGVTMGAITGYYGGKVDTLVRCR